MSYQVLARKFRPKSFEQLVGQQHVSKALENAINQDRLHHAYLFTGTRGVGKTTIARILAKCLNCEQGTSANPCGVCDTCVNIDAGKYLDLIEVDAASKTKVEDTKEILDNVQYSPVSGKYKVYLIDEVHMLSGHSFNALLKTLEEPPAHVKFLLATTEDKKLPITILSRCLRFNLRPLQISEIIFKMTEILDLEKIIYAKEALEVIANAAMGSMRDALSILDQAIGYSAGDITLKSVNSMLGNTEVETLLSLARALAKNDSKLLFELVDSIDLSGVDYTRVVMEFVELMHNLSVAKACDYTKPIDKYKNAEELISLFSDIELQLLYQIGLKGAEEINIAPSARVGFEMLLLRMLAFRPAIYQRESIEKSLPATEQVIKKEVVRSKPSAKENKPLVQEAYVKPANKSETNKDTLHNNMSWEDIIKNLNLSGINRIIVENSVLKEMKFGVLNIVFAVEQRPMLSTMRIKALEDIFSKHFNRRLKIEPSFSSEQIDSVAFKKAKIKKQANEQAKGEIEADQNVKDIMQMFDAKLENVTSTKE